jgi:hypothetical protein
MIDKETQRKESYLPLALCTVLGIIDTALRHLVHAKPRD